MTFTTRAGVTTCDHCGTQVSAGWRTKADHSAHHIADAERLARSRATGRKSVPNSSTERPQVVHTQHAESPTFATFLSAGWVPVNGKIQEQSEAAPSVNSGPPLDTPVEGASK